MLIIYRLVLHLTTPLLEDMVKDMVTRRLNHCSRQAFRMAVLLERIDKPAFCNNPTTEITSCINQKP